MNNKLPESMFWLMVFMTILVALMISANGATL